MTPAQREALEAYEQHGSQRKAAAALGISKNALQDRLVRAKQWLDAPEGQKAAIEVSGLDIGAAKHGWRVIQHKDGSRDSVFWKAEQEGSEDWVRRFADAMADIPRAPVIAPPDEVQSDLVALYASSD